LTFSALFPEQSVLTAELERQFQYSQVMQNRKAASWLLLLGLVLLSGYSLLDYLSTGADPIINRARMLIALPMLVGGACQRYISVSQFVRCWLLLISVLLVVTAIYFGVAAQHHGFLNEGGPMLVVFFIGATPFFTVRHKLLLCMLFLVALFACQYWFAVQLYWSIGNSSFTACLVLFTQMRMARLQRRQFKSEMLEAQRAITDQLTGIHNRRGFEQCIEQLLSSLPANQKLALAFIDIDYFKQYNDNYGHLEGDRVLQQLAQTLSDMQFELVARFGGEEFIVVERFSGSCPVRIPQICRAVTAGNMVHGFSAASKLVTVSVGVATTAAVAQPDGISELLRLADERLYLAKQRGRNQTVTEH